MAIAYHHATRITATMQEDGSGEVGIGTRSASRGDASRWSPLSTSSAVGWWSVTEE